MEQRYRRIADLMLRVGRMCHRIIDGRIRGLGIHPSQHILLMHLARLGRMPSQTQIAETLDVSAASVARTLKGLEAAGYIERSSGSTDSRRNEICITEKGAEIMREGRQIFNGVDEAAYANFTPAELDQLAGLLEKMQNNLAALERETDQRS